MAVAQARVSRAGLGVRLREPAIRGAQLLAASGFALAQPLFDLLGKNAEFFAAHGSTPGDIVLFALVVTFVPAIVLLAVELLVDAISRLAGLVLHCVFLGALGMVFAVQALKRSGVDGTTALIVGAVLIGLAIGLASWRLSAARSFLTWLAVAPIVFLCWFLFGTPVQHLVFPNANARAAAAYIRHPVPVVFLLFDEFPTISLENKDGNIDAGRFPNFARLAQHSMWFRNMTTVSSTTTVAVPALLTGQYPKRHSLPVFQDHPNNLFTLLGESYRLNVTETQTSLCPKRLCKRKGPSASKRLSSLYSDARTVYLHLLAPPELEDRLDPIDESWANFGADTGGQLESRVKLPKVNLKTFYIGRLHDYNRFLASLRPPGSVPDLDYLHVLFPHGPWLYFPDGRLRAVTVPRAPGRTEETWWDEGLARQAWQRHLLQVGFTDKLLGRFIDRLQKTGLWDKALIVMTVDEGDSFRGGDSRRDPSKTNLGDIAFIPLFVKLPGQTEGGVVRKHVTSVDVLPTIASVLGVKPHWKLDGHSVLAKRPGPSTVRVSGFSMRFGAARKLRMRARNRKLSLFGGGDWGPRMAATGRYWRLVGERPRASGSVDAAATVDAVGSRLLRKFPRNSQLVPSPLAGSISGLAKGTTLAFALNGRIAAVTGVYREPAGGALRFSALVGEAGFRTGKNTVQAYVVTGPATSPTLRKIRVKLS